MAGSIPSDLMKKVTGLRSLRDALSLIRKEVERQNKLVKDMGQGSPITGPSLSMTAGEVVPFSVAPQPGTPATKPKLQHLGRKMTAKGIITHMVGVQGSGQPHYELHVDMNKIGRAPHVSVAKMGATGSVMSRNPTAFRNLDEAIKSVSQHNKTGEW